MSKTTIPTSATSPPPSTQISSSSTTTTTLTSERFEAVKAVLVKFGVSASLPQHSHSNDFYSHLFSHLLHVRRVDRGHVSCSFSVLPAITNYYNGLHGGVIAAVAERVSIACARTVVAPGTDIFLGELSMSYLSAALLNEELIVDGSVVRSGRNLTVVEMKFRMKKNEKLVYTARATMYNMPIANL